MTTLLRPGILVSLKTTLRGGVSYSRVDLDAEKPEGRAVERWETTKIVDDPAEHKRATKARSAAGAKVRSVCAPTAFGLLCPEGDEAKLNAAIEEARAIVSAHNADARSTHVDVFVLKGRIASTDDEAARAIASDVRDLLDTMQAGIKAGDVAKIREAANKATQLGRILDPAQEEKMSQAIQTARSAARAIVKRVQKDGEDAALVIQELSTAAIERARFAFLDLDEAPAPEGEAMPAVNVQRFAELDTDEDEPAPSPSEPGESAETLAASAAE
jgi:hypothetical protein